MLSVNGKRGLNVHAYLWALLRFAVDSVAETPLWQDFGAESAPDHRKQTQGAVCPSKISAKTEEKGFGRVWTGQLG